MLFVGLRNTKDFDSAEDVVEIKRVLNQLDAESNASTEVLNVPHRIIFAEIFIRFRKDYSAEEHQNENQNNVNRAIRRHGDWSVSFYKILTFDVLNYDPKE